MTEHLQKRPSLGVWLLLVIVLVAIGFVMAWYQGVYNWDLVAYTAVVLEYQGIPPANLHQATFQLLQEALPNDVFSLLTTGERYNAKCFAEPAFFLEQLGFYRVKPVFTGMVYIGYAAGLPLKFALILPSLLGYLGLGLVSFWWCSKILSAPRAFVAVVLLMASFPLIGARLITPDALSAAGVMVFLAGIRFQWPWVWMLLAGLFITLVRIDHAILPVVWLGVCYLPSFHQRANYRLLLPLLLIIILAVVLPLAFGNQAGWFFQYRFTQSLREYAVQMANSIRQFSGTLLPVLLVLIGVAWRAADAQWRRTLVTIGLVIGLRWLLFPVMQERFFLGYEMVGVLFLIEILRNAGIILHRLPSSEAR